MFHTLAWLTLEPLRAQTYALATFGVSLVSNTLMVCELCKDVDSTFCVASTAAQHSSEHVTSVLPVVQHRTTHLVTR